MKNLLLASLASAMIFLLPAISYGQASTKDLLEKYEYGKQLLAEKKYGLAAEVLGSVARQDTGNDIPLYARYLQANALFKSGNARRAQPLLKKIIQENYAWNKVDEARFLLGVIHFNNALPDDALKVLNQIRNSSLYAEIDTLKQQQLASYSADQLQFLYQSFSSDTVLAAMLFKKMKQLPFYDRDEALFNKLAMQFAADSTNAETSFEPIFKEVYNIAVLLPFNKDFTNSNRLGRSNQIAYDLYQGMQIGRDLLAEENINIKLHAFDTQQDSAQTAAILSDSAMRSMDLIIGPLYGSTVPTVVDYSKTYQVPMLNPVSSNSVIIADNPNGFLLYPTAETQGKQMASYALENFKGSYAYIIYGQTEPEQKLAESFQKYLVDRGATIKMFEAFDYSKKGYQNLLKSLNELKTIIDDKEEAALIKEYNIKPAGKHPAYIFAALNDAVSAVSLVSALQTLQANYVKIIAPAKWLEFNQLTYDQLERSNVYMFYPNFHSDDSASVIEAKKAYVEKMNIPPFDYALDGIEAVYTFGKSLYKHGTGFRNAIHFDGITKGTIFEGLNYGGGNDNQYLPIFTFKEGKLQKVFPFQTEEPQKEGEIKE